MDEAFLKALREKLLRLREWLRERPVRFWLFLLIGIALLYYGSYYRHDIRFRDEGGTVALNAQRLLNGERPLVDVILNYNVLWYYPVVGLFKVFGVNFVLMRVFFFALSALAATLGFFAVTRAGHRGIAFCAALICVLVPGMIFKNYIPLLVIANSYVLMLTALSAPGSGKSYGQVAFGGLLLGTTFLIRIDLGLFFTVLWCGLHVLRLLDPHVARKQKTIAALGGIALTVTLAALAHLPVLIDAHRRGFGEPFTRQYFDKVQLIDRELRVRLGMPAVVRARRPPENAEARASSAFQNREILRRTTWQDFIQTKEFGIGAMVVLTNLPILIITAVLGWTLIRFSGGLRANDPADYRQPLAALVLLGGLLTAFPQFFFFRPDAPHLSEFSPGYWVGVAGAILLLGGSPGCTRIGRYSQCLLLLLLGAHAALYLIRMLPDRWTGTIAARQYRDQRFSAENGVDVYVSSQDKTALEAICRIVKENSAPKDYLVAYPYHPAINVMTNRRTYEKDVYVDNATRGRRWDEQAITRFDKFKPAVIVLSDWAVNGHDASRFSVWAAPTKAWVQAHYKFRGAFKTDVDEFELYTRL